MKSSYIGTLLLAILRATSAKENASCPDTMECMSVTHDILAMEDMSSSFGRCLVTCMEDETTCCSQKCAQPLNCRTNFANCHLTCRDLGMPPRFDCLDSCISVWNNCRAEAVTEPQIMEHHEHCKKDFRSCRKTCRKD
ncbi:hypothetical protein N7504_005021 [Penicillium tannophilum]|nr:hypothetical protein N7504_005021 [Penicillium tannophilum]